MQVIKLPFLNTNTNVSKLSDTDLNKAVADLLQNELCTATEFITIVYTFTCTHGRTGDKFAAKLAEGGDNVNYFISKDRKYQITGKTEKVKCDKNAIVQLLTSKIEIAYKYNCNLVEWNIA